jgi:hypothetical protein
MPAPDFLLSDEFLAQHGFRRASRLKLFAAAFNNQRQKQFFA